MSYAIGNTLNFLSGGVQPPSAVIAWCILNCADKLDTAQRKIQEEIDRVVGKERLPTWEDRQKMPFTTAYIWEIHRWRPVNPIGLPRG